MRIEILKEAGYEEAMLGLSLNHNQPIEKMEAVSDRLAHLDGGHNKFLESIVVWLDITAPRYWWQEFDTYRVGVTKQSESTIHTIHKRQLTADDFEGYIDFYTLDKLNKRAHILQHSMTTENLVELKGLLPESFLQRRIVCTNYKTLRNMYHQRKHHRLPEWSVYFAEAMSGLRMAHWVTGGESCTQ